LPREAAERARQTNFLMRRGFSGETIRRVLRGEHENEQS
jgi:SOS response regulatory protein OraA/RecX